MFGCDCKKDHVKWYNNVVATDVIETETYLLDRILYKNKSRQLLDKLVAYYALIFGFIHGLQNFNFNTFWGSVTLLQGPGPPGVSVILTLQTNKQRMPLHFVHTDTDKTDCCSCSLGAATLLSSDLQH